MEAKHKDILAAQGVKLDKVIELLGGDRFGQIGLVQRQMEDERDDRAILVSIYNE